MQGAALMILVLILVVVIFFIVSEWSDKLSPVPEGQLPEPGLTPRNPLYFVDRLAEDFLLFVYLEPQRKAQVAFRLAKEKRAEIEFLGNQPESASLVVEEVNKQAIIKSQTLFDKYLAIATENLIKAQQGVDIPSEITYEYLDQRLSQTSSGRTVGEKLYDALPQGVKNKLNEFSGWLKEKQHQTELWYQEQKAKVLAFLQEYLKQKAINFIDSLFK